MSSRWQELIPEQQHDAVKCGLRSVFQGDDVDCEEVSGGVSGAVTLRMKSAKLSLLLRAEGARTPLRNPHQYTCMQIAAEVGVAPRLHYVDDQAGIALMDFIVQRPIQTYPGGAVGLACALGRIEAKLQSASPFPVLVDHRIVVRRLLERLQDRFAPGLLDPHRRALESVCESMPWEPSAHVASHNDPNPRNVLFDGERLWLIDWETAYRNHPLIDVAILVDNFSPQPSSETELLQAWSGREIDADLMHDLKLAKALIRLYYAGLLGALGPALPTVTSDLMVLNIEDFKKAIANGSLNPSGPETRMHLAKMQLARFLSDFDSK